MKKPLRILTVLLMLVGSAAIGQTVTGNVTSQQDKSALPGVSVVLKGTTIGTSTDADGNYSLQIGNDANAVLVFSFIGFKAQEVVVGSRSSVDVVMEDDVSELGEVVVTAMGYEQEKENLGYAITKVKGDDLTKAGVTQNPFVALYGRAAGVQISQGVAGPTGGVNIKVRGAASLNATLNTRPLFVVDGVIIRDEATSMENRGYDPLNSFDYGTGINDLNPADIESIEILSGARASVLYGSQGGNGVVLITSKKGKNTRGLGVQFSYQHTVEKPFTYIDFQNEYGTGRNQYDIDFVEIDGQDYRTTVLDRFNFGPKFDGSPIRFFDGTTIPYQADKNNFMDLFRNGHTDNLSVAISGNSDFGNMRLSYSRDDYSGIMNNFDRRRNTVTLNGQIKASKFATFEVNTSLNSIETHNRLPNIQQLVAWGLNRDYPFANQKAFYKDETGYRRDTGELGLPQGVNELYSVLWEQNDNSDTDQKLHLIGSVKSTFNIKEWLSFVVFAGLDYTNTDFITENRVTRIVPEIVGGKYSFGKTSGQVQTYNSFLNFDKAFMGDRLNIFSFVGAQYQRFSDDAINVSTYGDLMFPDYYSLNNESNWPGANDKGKVRGHTRGSNVMYGVLGSATLSWDEIYYLELSGRKDWDSTLPPGNNSYFYPGASFTWKFSEMFTIPHLQFGNVRASWADVGRGTSRYYTNSSYEVATIPNTNAITVNSPSDLYLGDLGEEYQPERKREIELGFNTKFFSGNRFEVDFSFYSNNVYGQIMKVPISAVAGGHNIRINAGEIKNHGYELMLKGTPIVNNQFKWDVSMTAARQQSEVGDLYRGIDKITIGGSAGGYLIVAEKGKPYGDIQMFDYQKDPQGRRVVSNGGFYQLEDKKLTTSGNINPKVFGGFFSDLYWKGFNFHVGLDYKFGGTIFSYSNYYLTGNGITKNTLKYRDEEHGGLAYYLDDDGQKVAWQHGNAAPPESSDGLVYHDGLILPGVKEQPGPGGEMTYVENDVILSAYEYYSSFNHDVSTGFQPDNLFKNDYIKLREISVSYTVPQKFVEKIRLQKVTVSLIARNLFYLYKTIPNIDPESSMGANSYYENSFYPSVRSYGFGVNASF
jgi:iron complex outermembrane recepter protein